MDGLNAQSAQKIANDIMHIVPHNITIIDRMGYVISSVDSSLINTIKMDAIEALATLRPYVSRNSANESGAMYLPVFHNKHAVGAVEIDGEPEEIATVAHMIAFAAELILDNQEYQSLALRKTAITKDFLLEWANLPQIPYPKGMVERGKSLGIDIDQNYAAIILECEEGADKAKGLEKLFKSRLDRGETLVWCRDGQFLIAVPPRQSLAQRVEVLIELFPVPAKVYVGEAVAPLSVSIQQAGHAQKLAQTLGIKRKAVYYQEICLEQTLLSATPSNIVLKLQNILAENDNGGDLIDTICIYMDKRDDITSVCKELHIHRNTLNYRLNRIEELSEKNPRRGKDLLELYLAALRIKTGKANN